MAGTLLSPALTGPRPIDAPRQDSAVRLPLRSTVLELLAGSAVAAVVSLALQFAAARLGISEPSFAPEALASLGAAVVLLITFGLLAFGRLHVSRPLRLVATWVGLSAFTTLALAIPLQSTRYYFGGASVDNGFRMQYMTRMASTLGLADMNYADTAPYYPGGWFWLGGRFANLLGWEGWAAYKPYALIWVAVTAVVAFTLWSVVVRRRLALLAGLATALAGMLHGIEEPYAWPSAAWLPTVAVLAWYALRRPDRAPRWTLLGVGIYVGFAAATYTLHFGFAVLLIVAMAVVLGVFRVRRGEALWPTARVLFLRLLPIGVVSGVLALVVWAPYVVGTKFFLANPRSAAQHYLPQDGSFLPVPMTEPTPFGVLCLVGFCWLLLRARQSRVAAPLLMLVLSIYVWFGLSTLALIAKTTLLSFRLNVILGAVLAVAGVFGLLELIGWLRERLDLAYAARITTISCAVGLIGAISLTQEALSTKLEEPTKMAYEDYYPTGDNAMGGRDPQKAASWADDVYAAVDRLTGRQPTDNVLLTTDYKIMSFRPYWGFQQETPHYANPLARYSDRAQEIERWSKARTPDELVAMLQRSPFRPPNVFVLRNPLSPYASESDKERAADPTAEHGRDLAVTLKGDAFPQQPNVSDRDVHFDPALFNSPRFVRQDVGPYAVIALR